MIIEFFLTTTTHYSMGTHLMTTNMFIRSINCSQLTSVLNLSFTEMDLSLADNWSKDPKSSVYELITLPVVFIGLSAFIMVCIYKEEIFSYWCSGCKKPNKTTETTETTDLPPPYEPPPTYEEALELARLANHQPPNQCTIQIG